MSTRIMKVCIIFLLFLFSVSCASLKVQVQKSPSPIMLSKTPTTTIKPKSILNNPTPTISEQTATPKNASLIKVGNQPIAYMDVSGQSCDIYLINTDGSGKIMLTHNSPDIFMCEAPIWSPNSKEILYNLIISNNNLPREKRVINSDGTNDIKLIGPVYFSEESRWSPNSELISFIGQTSTDTRTYLYLINPNGSGLLNIAPKPNSHGEPNRFDWSPDGKKIVFLSEVNSGVYSVNSDGTNEKKIVDVPSGGFWGNVKWSPDGKMIVFTGLINNKQSIYTVNADGSDLSVVLSDPKTSYNNPIWSPDGEKIIYELGFYGDNDDPQYIEIYRMNSDGTNQINLTNNQSKNHITNQCWSPDGGKIVFSRIESEGEAIYIMDNDGKNQTRLTSGNYPSWKP